MVCRYFLALAAEDSAPANVWSRDICEWKRTVNNIICAGFIHRMDGSQSAEKAPRKLFSTLNPPWYPADLCAFNHRDAPRLVILLLKRPSGPKSANEIAWAPALPEQNGPPLLFPNPSGKVVNRSMNLP